MLVCIKPLFRDTSSSLDDPRMSYCQYWGYQGTIKGGHKGPCGRLV